MNNLSNYLSQTHQRFQCACYSVSLAAFNQTSLIYIQSLMCCNLYMQSGMSTLASRSKTGFRSYIPELIVTLRVEECIRTLIYLMFPVYAGLFVTFSMGWAQSLERVVSK